MPLSFTGGKHHSVLTGRVSSKDRRQDSKGCGSRTESGPMWSVMGGGGGEEMKRQRHSGNLNAKVKNFSSSFCDDEPLKISEVVSRRPCFGKITSDFKGGLISRRSGRFESLCQGG